MQPGVQQRRAFFCTSPKIGVRFCSVNSRNNPRVDLGIAIAHAKTAGLRRLTHKEIAAFCDCTWQGIWHIEQKALKKIQNTLYILYSQCLKI